MLLSSVMHDTVSLALACRRLELGALSFLLSRAWPLELITLNRLIELAIGGTPNPLAWHPSSAQPFLWPWPQPYILLSLCRRGLNTFCQRWLP
jgi:hypothetical protein